MLFFSLIAYSQRTLLNNNDTLICFSVKESKFLLKKVYEVNKLDELLSLCENKSSFKDSIITSNNILISGFEKKEQNYKKIIGLKDDINLKLQDDLKKETDKTKHQRNMKRIWKGITAFVSSCFIVYITKH